MSKRGPEQFIEDHFNYGAVSTTVARSMEVPFQRNGTENHRSRQTFEVFDYVGNTENPAEAEYVDVRTKIRRRMVESGIRLSMKEQEYMGRLLPDLVKALVLDEQYIDKVHKKDLQPMFDVATDWFMHPEMIDRTHLRIGFGGEELVNSRAPAYIVPALETVSRLKETYANYTNWALHNALCDKEGINGDEVNQWTDNELPRKNLRGIPNGQVLLSASSSQQADEVFARKNKKRALLEKVQSGQDSQEIDPIQRERQVLMKAWSHFTGQEPDMEELASKYHFTDKLPKIVVFNAAHAAVEINSMDPEKVLAARNSTQQLIRTYVQEFHPDLADNIVFQNDAPWSEHDYYTQMKLQYTKDLINSQDGERAKIDDSLEQYSKHHKKNGKSTIMGMPPYKAYAILHADFFADPQETEDWSEKLPKSTVMEPMEEEPWNLIYHGGPPERTFGFYRNIYREKATVSGMIKWLDTRYVLAKTPAGDLAEDISRRTAETQERRQAIPAKDQADQQNGKTNANVYPAYLRQAMDKVFKDTLTTKSGQENRGNYNILKRYFSEFLQSSIFQESETPEQAWADFTADLRANKPQEDPDQILALRDELKAHRDRLFQFKVEANHARQNGDNITLHSLVNSPDGRFISSPRRKVEMMVSVGDRPVYYKQEGDSEVYPKREKAALAKYEHRLSEVKAREKRMKGTLAYAEAKVIPGAAEASDDLWGVFGDGITMAVDARLRDQRINTGSWISADAQKLQQIYAQADIQEVAGEIETVYITLNTGAKRILSSRTEALKSEIGLDANSAVTYVAKKIAPQVAREAYNKTMGEIAVDIATVEAVMKDYKLMLRDIDPSIAALESRKKALEGNMGKRNANGKVEVKTQLDALNAQIAQAYTVAETRYNDLLARTFGTKQDGIDHGFSMNGKSNGLAREGEVELYVREQPSIVAVPQQ